MKYQFVAHPNSNGTYLDDTEYEDIQDAVMEAMSRTAGTDFLIVTVVPWKAVVTDMLATNPESEMSGDSKAKG